MGIDSIIQITVLFRYFVIAGIINTGLFAFLLLASKRNTIASFLLIVIMAVFSFQALINAFDTRDFFLANPHLSRISWVLPTLFGPLIYLFVKKLTTDEEKLYWKDLVHFVAFVVYFIILSPWFFTSANNKRALLEDFDKLSLSDFGWMNQLSILIILFYCLLSLRQLKIYSASIENRFSELSNLRLEWMKKFIYFVLIILAISALGFYGRKWNLPFLTNFYHYNYALIVLVLYWIAYKCLTQPQIFKLEKQPAPGQYVPVLEAEPVEVISETVPAPAVKYLKSGLDNESAGILYERLLFHMKSEKPYLEHDLNIYKLSEQIGTSRHYLSQVINEKAGKSFFDFINGFRVEEAQAKLTDPSMANKSILGIAFDSGFNSKATFNTTFKKHSGMTPSAYQKSLSK
jgi:AraC-like DNA-binding protein